MELLFRPRNLILLSALIVGCGAMAGAESVDLHTLSENDPSCVRYVADRGCVVADLGPAFISWMTAEDVENRNDVDVVTWIERALDLNDVPSAIDFARTVQASGTAAAGKAAILAKIKALPLTLAWEGFRRNTEHNLVYLMNEEAVALEVAADYRSLFGSEETEALFDAISQDRFWPMLLHYSPIGMGDTLRGFFGRTGERTARFGFTHPTATPSMAQVVDTGSWSAPTLEFPDAWLHPSFVMFVTRPGNLYTIVMKEPMLVRGMQDARISISLASRSLRGTQAAFADYHASRLDGTVEMTVPERSPIEIVPERSPIDDQAPLSMDDIRLPRVIVTLDTFSADSDFEELARDLYHPSFSVASWQDIRSRYASQGERFLRNIGLTPDQEEGPSSAIVSAHGYVSDASGPEAPFIFWGEWAEQSEIVDQLQHESGVLQLVRGSSDNRFIASGPEDVEIVFSRGSFPLVSDVRLLQCDTENQHRVEIVGVGHNITVNITDLSRGTRLFSIQDSLRGMDFVLNDREAVVPVQRGFDTDQVLVVRESLDDSAEDSVTGVLLISDDGTVIEDYTCHRALSGSGIIRFLSDL